MTPRFGIGAATAAAAILIASMPAPATAQLTDPFAPPPTKVRPVPHVVAWSPDGRYQAVAFARPPGAWGGKLAVVIGDTVNGNQLRELQHDDDVESVAWSPDGRFLASAESNIVRVWDVASGKTVDPSTVHRGDVHSVAWSPDGRFLASGSSDKTVQIRDAASGTTLRSLTGHTSTIWSVAWSPDGRYLASGGGYPSHNNSGATDATVRIWDAATGKQVRSLAGHSDVVKSVAWSPDGRFIASGSRDNTLRIWDAASFTPLRTLTGHSSGVNSVAWSPDGRFLASGSSDKTVRVWDVASGKTVLNLTEHDWVNSVTWSPDGSALASNWRVHPNVLSPSSAERMPRQSAPNQYAALAQSGQARIENRDYEGAEADFTKALAESPPISARAELYFARAYARYLQGQPDRAVEDLDAALKLKPDSRAYSLRGRIKLEQQNYSASKDDLDRALELDPPGVADSAEAHYLRARAEMGLGDRNAAVEDLSAAIGQSPRIDFYFERANLYRAAGAADKALADYGTVLKDEKAPEFLRTRAHLGRALIHHARRDASNAMADYDDFFAGIPAADEQTRAFGAAIVQRLSGLGLYSGKGEKYDAALRSALSKCVRTPQCAF